MRLYGPINSGAAAGSAGAATANSTTSTPIHGRPIGVYVRYNDSPPAGTTDVTVKTQGTSPAAPSLTFLTLTNAATDGYFYPRTIVHDLAGAAVTLDGTNEAYEPVAIADKVTVTIAGADAADSVDVWLFVQ